MYLQFLSGELDAEEEVEGELAQVGMEVEEELVQIGMEAEEELVQVVEEELVQVGMEVAEEVIDGDGGVKGGGTKETLTLFKM